MFTDLNQKELNQQFLWDVNIISHRLCSGYFYCLWMVLGFCSVVVRAWKKGNLFVCVSMTVPFVFVDLRSLGVGESVYLPPPPTNWIKQELWLLALNPLTKPILNPLCPPQPPHF